MTEQEEWRVIRNRHGQNSKYDVSSLGRVRSQNPGFEGKILKGGEGPANPSTAIRRVWLTDVTRGPNTPVRVDQLVAKAFLEDPPDGTTRITHKNGCIWDDRADNLAWEAALDRTSTPTPTPIPALDTIDQLRAKEKMARKAVQDALDALIAVQWEVARAMAAEAVQRRVQEIAQHGMG